MSSHDHDHDHPDGHGHDHGHAHAPAPPPAPAAHDHGHDHGHAHTHDLGPVEGRERRVTAMFALVLSYMVVEAVGGWWSGSLALVADAGHMSSDAAALLVVLFAMRLARAPATPEHTYGYHRAEVLAATLNGGALLLVAGGILWEAWERISAPPSVAGLPMLLIAGGGLAVNVLGLVLFHRDREGDLNLRGAWMHVLFDAIGSVGAMLAGLAVWRLGWNWVDPVVSVLIAGLVVWGARGLLRDAVRVLMEGAPSHIDVAEVRGALRALPGVLDVHDLHVWTIASGQVSLSAHLRTGVDTPCGTLLAAVQEALRVRFGIAHSTIQIEPPEFEEGHTHP